MRTYQPVQMQPLNPTIYIHHVILPAYANFHILNYHANHHTYSDNKDLIILLSFIWAFVNSYLGCHCLHVQKNHKRFLFVYFAVEQVSAFKKICAFRVSFQSKHYHILWTGPYQVIVPTHASTQRPACDVVMTNEKAFYILVAVFRRDLSLVLSVVFRLEVSVVTIQ